MNVTVNGNLMSLAAERSVAELLKECGLDGKPAAVEVNGRLVPRREHAQHRLCDGDRVEIVTLVGGG